MPAPARSRSTGALCRPIKKPGTTFENPRERRRVGAPAEAPKRIYRTVEIVDGREVVRYSDKAPAKPAPIR